MLEVLPGWVGISAILLAYFLITTKRTDRSSSSYHLLNLGGSLLLIYDASLRGATAFLVLNTAWALIALFALFSPRKKTKKRTK